MIGFDKRTDNKEKIGLEGTGGDVCDASQAEPRGGLVALTVICKIQ